MNTIQQPEVTGRGARKSTSGSSARPDMVDVVLLLVTILALMSAAAGIAIGFPLALEVVSTRANAATAGYPAPQERPLHRHQEISEGPLGSDPGEAHGIGVSTARPRSASRSHPASGPLLHVPPIPAPPLDARNHLEPEEESEEYDEPLIVDDVRSEARMYAAAGIASLIDRSAPAATGNDVPERLSQ
jgi:hypothetical protein